MISTYRPHYGSVADRAMAHLRKAGHAVAARPIADAIDVDIDVLHNALRTALQAGAVVKEKREGLVWYSLGNGPLPKPEDPEEVDDAPPVRRFVPAPNTPPRDSQQVLKAEAARPDATDRETPAIESPGVGPMGAGQPADAGPALRTCTRSQVASSPVEKPEVASLPRVRAGTAPFRCGVFSDGELHLQKAGQSIVLERPEFETLVHFLERMVEGAA